jgi:prolyl-tRNA editing enzyme YbaK/EbsC (Cys-tRNA(Pro) deacylase)
LRKNRPISSPPPPLPRAAQRVAAVLRERGHSGTVRLLDASARSAAEAAGALGVRQEQIVKSLVFRGLGSGQVILALVGGTDRVGLGLLEAAVGEPVERAPAEWVREHTGYAIGGVPPLGHSGPVLAVADAGLLELDELWAAAGTPHAVFPLRGDEIVALTGARLAAIAASA